MRRCRGSTGSTRPRSISARTSSRPARTSSTSRSRRASAPSRWPTFPEPIAPMAIDEDPERASMLRSQQHDVRLANGKLESRQRLVLALRELEDRSYAEIGEIVGLKENAVAQLIFRARESLRVEVRLAQVDPERFPETCRVFLPLLAKHLDGELKGKRLTETLAHLEGCERCQSALGDMREASRRYRALFLPPLLDGDECKAAIDSRLDESGFWAAPERRDVLVGCGASPRSAPGVIALGVGGTALGVGSRGGDEPTTMQTAGRRPRSPRRFRNDRSGRPATRSETPTRSLLSTRRRRRDRHDETVDGDRDRAGGHRHRRPAPTTTPTAEPDLRTRRSAAAPASRRRRPPTRVAPTLTITSGPTGVQRRPTRPRSHSPPTRRESTFNCSTDGSEAARARARSLLTGLARRRSPVLGARYRQGRELEPVG